MSQHSHIPVSIKSSSSIADIQSFIVQRERNNRKQF